MLLNVDTVVNDSKKISELRKLTKITKHQENSWVPMAQYNSRTDTYTNAAINLRAITTYNVEHSYSYLASEFGSNWIDLLKVGTSEGTDNIGKSISNSIIANNVLSYTFTYTIRHLDWQIVNGSYVPGYYVPNHPDNDEPRLPMEAPDFNKVIGNDSDNEIYDNV